MSTNNPLHNTGTLRIQLADRSWISNNLFFFIKKASLLLAKAGFINKTGARFLAAAISVNISSLIGYQTSDSNLESGSTQR